MNPDEIYEAEEVQPVEVVAAQPMSIEAAPGVDILPKAEAMANALAGMIRQQGLAVRLQGKQHVTVEGWTTLAAMMGLAPTEVSNERLEDGSYLATVALMDTATGQEVGRASAECGDGEPMWMSRPAYARRSMAATRATSKVCRVRLSWIMKLAGYEVTPAEEMPRNERSEPQGMAPEAFDAIDAMLSDRELIEGSGILGEAERNFFTGYMDRFAKDGENTRTADAQFDALRRISRKWTDHKQASAGGAP